MRRNDLQSRLCNRLEKQNNQLREVAAFLDGLARSLDIYDDPLADDCRAMAEKLREGSG